MDAKSERRSDPYVVDNELPLEMSGAYHRPHRVTSSLGHPRLSECIIMRGEKFQVTLP